jgi:superfamily II DNA or RNA helicase
MAQRLSLRQWQQEALRDFESRSRCDYLAVATPGAGKTTFALAACVRALGAGRAKRVVVVAPTRHLKLQWAEAAERFGLSLAHDWASSDGALPRDLHGVVVTYQQLAANPRSLRSIAKASFAIIDEVHHAADTRAWGDGLRVALEGAAQRLCLSGTPFRSDQNAIPFVRYQGDDARPDYEYGYGDALKDRRVVRPVFFPRIGGHMEWTAPDGGHRSFGFQDTIGRTLASQRLRTALSPENDWLPAVLEQAHAQLCTLRERDPSAGGMVIAIDQDHARAIADLLHARLGVRPIVATSDEPDASERIARFAAGDAHWIVAVRMVSEGVDIPRLRVGVFATNTMTDLFFRQAVGRLVRWTEGQPGQRAFMFIPDDPRLRGFAWGIREQRRHSLRKPDEPEESPPRDEAEPEETGSEDEQMSLFSVISAVALDEDGRPLDRPTAIEADLEYREEAGLDEEAEDDKPDDADDVIEVPIVGRDFQLAPAPDAIEHESLILASDTPDPSSPLSNRERRKQLREQNTARARQLSRRFAMTHAEVNAELNRRTGIRRITEATQDQLERRIQVAETWLRRR